MSHFPLADAVCDLCAQPAYLHRQFSWNCPGTIGWLEGLHFTDKGLIPVSDAQEKLVANLIPEKVDDLPVSVHLSCRHCGYPIDRHESEGIFLNMWPGRCMPGRSRHWNTSDNQRFD